MIRLKIKAIAIGTNGIEQEVEFEIPVVGQWSEQGQVVAFVDLGLEENIRVEFTPNFNFKAF